jgi:hypothetical protein
MLPARALLPARMMAFELPIAYAISAQRRGGSRQTGLELCGTCQGADGIREHRSRRYQAAFQVTLCTLGSVIEATRDGRQNDGLAVIHEPTNRDRLERCGDDTLRALVRVRDDL